MKFRLTNMIATLAIAAALAGLVFGPGLAPTVAAQARTVKNYFAGCSGSGCDNVLTIGGTIDIASGSTVKIAGVASTNIVDAVKGVAAGYKIARGATALDGSGSTTAATGLTTIVACTVSINLGTSPGVSTSVVTYTVSSANLLLWPWKVTATGDATLVASDGTQTVGWVCVGT